MTDVNLRITSLLCIAALGTVAVGGFLVFMDHLDSHDCPFLSLQGIDCLLQSGLVLVLHHVEGLQQATQMIAVSMIAAVLLAVGFAIRFFIDAPPHFAFTLGTSIVKRSDGRGPFCMPVKLAYWISLRNKGDGTLGCWVYALA